MSTQTYTVSTLLEKLTSPDKDFRYMAANDLMNELQKETLQIDDAMENKIVNALLKALDDKNGEVQNLAVKCLGPLIKRVKDPNAENIVGKLCDNTTSTDKDSMQLRDISSMAIKTVFQEMPPNAQLSLPNLVKKVAGKLQPYISKETVPELSIHLEILEIFGILLQKYGAHLAQNHSLLVEALFPLLRHQRMAVRKRAISALSSLSMTCSDEIFENLIRRLKSELMGKMGDLNNAKTSVQFLEGLSRSTASRFGKHLPVFVEDVIKTAQSDDDELKEYSFHTLETFLQKCQSDILPFVPKIVEVALNFLSYDPNYSYDGDEPDANEPQDDEGQYSDDEDMSWKVRRGAVKCLEAVITTRREYILDSLNRISPALVSRFIDREETVRVDVIAAFLSLLQQTEYAMGGPRRKTDLIDEKDSRTGSIAEALRQQLPALVKSMKRLISDKSLKSRQASLQLLGRLVQIMPGCLSDSIGLLLPGLEFCLSDKSSVSNIKLEALYFLQSMFTTHRPEVFVPHVASLVKMLTKCTSDTFYKVIAESLLATEQLITIIRPLDRPQVGNVQPLVPELYSTVFKRFKDPALDQEIKERAVSCMGQLFHTLGDFLTNELRECLHIFVDRLKNEPTRLSTVKALLVVVSSPLKNDITSVLSELLSLCTSFLRKKLRSLKVVTLELIVLLCRDYGDRVDAATMTTIVHEMPTLIQESDLPLSQVALQVIAVVGQRHPVAVISNKLPIVQRLVEISRSPVMQGSTMIAVIDVSKMLASVGSKDADLNTEQLIRKFLQPVYDTQHVPDTVLSATHRQGFVGTAKCVAALALASGSDLTVVNQCLDDILLKNSSESVKMIGLLIIAEIGYYKDLSVTEPKLSEALNFIVEHGKDDSKTIVSVALGKLCGGNVQRFVPAIVTELEKPSDKQYIFFSALKELISLVPSERIPPESIAPFVDRMWNALLNRASTVEEGYRSLLGECLGKLTALDPQRFVPVLVSVLQRSPSVQVKCTILNTIKFTISDERRPIDQLLKDTIAVFLSFLNDPDLSVRRSALTLFNSVAHNKPVLLKDKLSVLLPLVYKETQIKPELIREVEMGPFKHEVDDGLDCRKAAYECLYTLLNDCLEQLNILEFMDHVLRGLSDHYDIKTLCFLFVRRLVQAAPNALSQRSENFSAEISKTLNFKVKPNSVKQEHEKVDELKRAALRAVHALTLLPDADKSRWITELQSVIKGSAELLAMWETVKNESVPGGTLQFGFGDVEMR